MERKDASPTPKRGLTRRHGAERCFTDTKAEMVVALFRGTRLVFMTGREQMKDRHARGCESQA